ncbi:hypothetical protein RFI_28469 [Reticulomyxa filosa]|uniref:Uncharacterized protein n=1 Tax=Reticulomyxa filosa TaxID=46433 RepID=X6M5N3_RETFI|nr:hypothetical protein RFI_28469 [Reticulomyxa filosa]|eukprot:ETO08916.1 hypothetical protein RFI_28469 [Reticulomyxa filosa]
MGEKKAVIPNHKLAKKLPIAFTEYLRECTEKKTKPASNILVFRRGLGEVLFHITFVDLCDAIITNELFAIERSIDCVWKKSQKSSKKKSEGITRWRPKITFCTIEKSKQLFFYEQETLWKDSIDNWFEGNTNSKTQIQYYKASKQPFVVQDSVTYTHMWEIYFRFNVNFNHFLRVLVLKDDIHIRESKDAVSYFYQFIHTLCYGFAFGAPFRVLFLLERIYFILFYN